MAHDRHRRRQPQSTPIWFHWDGSTFVLYSQPDRPKVRNIAANPRVSLHLVGDPEGEDVITVEGIASLDPAAPPVDGLPPYVEKYAPRSRRSVGRPRAWPPITPVAVRVRPTRFRVVS